MWLSLRRAAYFVAVRAAKQEIRVRSEVVTLFVFSGFGGRKALQSIRWSSILGVLRLRAVSPLLGERSARRFAQDDDSVGELTEETFVREPRDLQSPLRPYPFASCTCSAATGSVFSAGAGQKYRSFLIASIYAARASRTAWLSDTSATGTSHQELYPATRSL